MKRLKCAGWTFNTARTQLIASKCVTSKTQISQFFPLADYGSESGFSLSYSVVPVQKLAVQRHAFDVNTDQRLFFMLQELVFGVASIFDF